MTDSEEHHNFNKNNPSESRTKRLRTFLYLIIGGLMIPGISFASITLGLSLCKWCLISNMHQFYVFLTLTLLTLSISIPLLMRVNSEYQRGEMSPPGDLERDTEVFRKSNQCKICKMHPISKKYHVKNVHNLKNVKIKAYFADCGCLKCAILSKPNYGVGG